MMWIAVHLAFAALPFVLTAALYSRKRRFPAGEGDARARDAKARKFYAQLLLVLLLLYHYAYTNGHPSGFGVLLSTGACVALFSSRRTDRWLRGLSGRPRAFAELALAARGYRLRARSVPRGRYCRLLPFGSSVLSLRSGHVRMRRQGGGARTGGASRNICRAPSLRSSRRVAA